MNKTNVNIESKNSLARLMATENLHIQHAKVSTASFDVKNRILRLPIWKEMDSTMYEGLIGHEVGHALYTSFEDWSAFVKDSPELKDYANIIEDARIEKKMKVKYPGMRKTFFSMYDSLSQKDFFGTQGRDLDTFGLADRINIHCKLGVRADVPFSDWEMAFVDRVADCETFEDVATLARELGEIAKKEEAESQASDLDDFDFGDDDNDEENEDLIPVPVSAPKSKDDEEKEKEEEDKPENDIPSAPSEKEEEKEDEDSDEDDGDEDSDEDGSADSGDENKEATNNDLPPTPETQKNFDDALGQMTDAKAKEPIYLDLPKVNSTSAIVPWKTTFSELNEHWANPEHFAHYYDAGIQSVEKEKNLNDFRAWKKDTAQIVNYMVKEFEMKQAATEYKRTSVGRSGQLDMNKLHKYKTDEDIFKRVASVKDGRNHGLMMWIDWSGSMSGKMEATIKQTLTLVMFAKKVGIPFRVYSFSNSNDLLEKLQGMSPNKFYDVNETLTDHMKVQQLGMNEYFSEKMSSKDFNKQVQNVFFLGKSLDYNGLATCATHGMSSTPLNECILAAHEMIADFRKETGKEKINAIFLTDGGADGNSHWHNTADGIEDRESYLGSGMRDNHYFVLRDPKTKRLLSGTGRRSLTNSLLANLGSALKINVIGFHITDRRTINQTIAWDVGYEESDKLRSFVNKNGYAPIKQGGYDTYFLVNDKALDKEVDFEGEAERTKSGDIAKGKLRTQFKKFTSGRKVNKMMLNEFVALVA